MRLLRRIWWHLRHPYRTAQSLVVLANVPPFIPVLRAIYRLGLRIALSRLERHDAIHSIYGAGSFFRGSTLYGHSDIDLVIVLDPGVKRAEGVQFRIAKSYERVRRVFPFLGSWDEKEGSLVFLDELEAGFPPSVPFRVLMKSGSLRLLYGEPFPYDLDEGPPSAADWMAEVDRLLRWAVVAGEDVARRAVFWERMFRKLDRATAGMGLADVGGAVQSADRLAVLQGSRRDLYFRTTDPGRLFGLFLRQVSSVVESARSEMRAVTLRYDTPSGQPPVAAPVDIPLYAASPAARAARSIPSGPIGLQPRLFYFSVDEPIVTVELEGDPYRALKGLLVHMKQQGERFDAVIARVEGFLFLLARQQRFVDVVPLDPLIFANLYAWLDGRLEWEMPEPLATPLVAEARWLFRALRDAYARHTGWLPKHAYPAIYREDDLDTIRDAFDILRSHFALEANLAFPSSHELVGYMSERYAGATDFLGALVEYREFFERGGRGRPPANNVYRCLHTFVARVLDGAEDVVIEDFDRHLGISVGIITRNRAPDLRNALSSLRDQTRPPEEIVLVDNGSTDDTRLVVDSFEGVLPIRYFHLAEASIPNARNLVLQHATQEIVSFTDDDCAIPPEWLSSVERGFLRADNVGIVGGWVEHWPAEVNTVVDTYYQIFHNHKT